MRIKYYLQKKIINIFRIFGYEINISFNIRKKEKKKDQVNLNIGAGRYEIEGFKSLDIYTPHYYKNKDSFLKQRIEYDIRTSSIPFKDNSVDNIYISHVLEHVENKYVINFIKESFRVLKKRGVLRIACPDSEFLFQVSQFDNSYWDWRINSLSNKKRFMTKWSDISQYDFLLRELSTPKMRFYKNKINNKLIQIEKAKELSYEELCEELKKDLNFRADHPGDHINNWDFERIKKIAISNGFGLVIRSKHRSSIVKEMRGKDFDKSHPYMSLYVECVK